MRTPAAVGRRAVAAILALALLAPSSPALAGPSNKWARVLALAPDSHVIVTRTDGSTVEGWFVGVRGEVMMLEKGGDIPRDRVARVVVVRDGRPWYAVPLIAGAAVVGVAASVAVLWGALTCHDCGESDAGPLLLAVVAAPAFVVSWVASRIEPRRSAKVIYEARR